MKQLFQLCDNSLKNRLLKERKSKLWTPFIDETLVDISIKSEDLNNSKNIEDQTTKVETPLDLDEKTIEVYHNTKINYKTKN